MKLSRIDIKSAAEKGFEYNFVIPDEILEEGEDGRTDIFVSVRGIGSRQHKQAKAEYDHAIEQLRKTAYRGKLDPEQEDQLLSEMIAKCTTGWKNVEDNDVQVDWSVDNAAMIFDKYPILRGAVAGALFDMRTQLKNL
jgi:hypothetical protein